MSERAGGNGTTPETHPELYAFPGPRESSGLREELAKMSMEIVDLKLTLQRVQALLERWERSLKDPYGIWDRATKVRELRAALKGGE